MSFTFFFFSFFPQTTHRSLASNAALLDARAATTCTGIDERERGEQNERQEHGAHF